MNIGLFTHTPFHRDGPSKVSINLLFGLRQIGVGVKLNIVSELNGCLNLICGGWEKLPTKTLIGPILGHTHDEYPLLWQRFEHVVLPSEWVRAETQQLLDSSKTKLHVWPAGIDCERFQDPGRKRNRDCLVYFKGQDEERKQAVIKELKQLNLSHSIIEYGSYQEEDMIELAQTSRFCLLVTRRETQGIGYMEILACGTPCFCLVERRGKDEEAYQAEALCHAPYLTPKCGGFGSTLLGAEFEGFFKKLNALEPRKYIVENFSLTASARAYVDLLEEVHNS